MTSPSMLLSLDRPSPPAAAAATLLPLLDAAAGDEGDVAVAGPEVIVRLGDDDVAVAEASVVVVVVVPLTGWSMRVTVKFAELVDSAEVLGRDQVVVGVEEQSVPASVAWAACSPGLGDVCCAWARVVAPRAARMWEGRIGWWVWVGRVIER